MSRTIYEESKDFGTYENQYLTAAIKVTQTADYVIFDKTSRCGQWYSDRFNHNERWNLPNELEVIDNAMTNAEITRESIRKADEWFNKVGQLAKQELAQPQPFQAYTGKNDIF